MGGKFTRWRIVRSKKWQVLRDFGAENTFWWGFVGGWFGTWLRGLVEGRRRFWG